MSILYGKGGPFGGVARLLKNHY
ncbi:hypothetical protein EYZ11_013515 [Aspergillus tanneri]|uniref:Uncharacterized protein n=1 Tax=Aspergillus tanneri TaxID=1220188 RepID=A0A4S3IXH0_9EURO|nr:hypothetical protein EYZ11_013515 [Aspergillus tanneri]